MPTVKSSELKTPDRLKHSGSLTHSILPLNVCESTYKAGHFPYPSKYCGVRPVAPMLLGRAASPPTSDDWSFEVKHDGWRAIVDVRRTRTTIWSRNGYNVTDRFSELSGIHKDVPPCVLDCELVVLDDDGRSRFEWIFRRNRPAATLFAFDVLRTNGRNTTAWTIERRRAVLRRLIPDKSPAVIRSRAFDDGVALLAECEKHRLEGIVAKRAGSPYRPGTRSDDWLKIRTAYGRELIRQRMENAHGR